MLCQGTDLAPQTWPSTCLIPRGFCDDDRATCLNLAAFTKLALLISFRYCGTGPTGCKVSVLAWLAVTLASSSPSLEFIFTATWRGRTLHKVLSKNWTSNPINLPSYTEGWMCNTINHTTTAPPQDVKPSSDVTTSIFRVTSSRSLCLSSLSVSSFCCKLRAFISNIACFFSRSLS